MATVIKAGQAHKPIRRLGAIDLADHVGEAQVVLDGAHASAREIIANAEKRAAGDAQRVLQEARACGFEKGYQEGLTAGREAALMEARVEFAQKHADLVASLKQAISELETRKEQIHLDAEKDVLEFAVLAASRLTFQIGELCREAAAANLRRALALVAKKTSLTVRCSPKDAESLRTVSDFDLGVLGSGAHVRFVEDQSIKAGGCVVQCGNAEVDASLETQVEQMVSVLIGRRDA